MTFGCYDCCAVVGEGAVPEVGHIRAGKVPRVGKVTALEDCSASCVDFLQQCGREQHVQVLS